MDKFIIQGGTPLIGEINISGAKNSVLPLMIATLLTDAEITLDNVPYLSDVVTLTQLLESLGVKVVAKSNGSVEEMIKSTKDTFQVTLNSSQLNNFLAPYSIVRRMRASFWVLGPLVARFGQAKVSLPGGCAIGTRQIDLHLAVLEAMGANISLEEGYIIANSKGPLKGVHFTFNKVSVGATINAIMCATLAEGESVFINCACEPEIEDLCHFLVKMGAEIENIGTSRLKIIGKKSLKGATHTVMPDRIEAGTYIAGVGLAKGKLKLNNIKYSLIENQCEKFKQAGYEIIDLGDSILVSADDNLHPVDIDTAPFPGFPTDMQAQFMALMCSASGSSTIVENLYENRFMHALELQRLGADITLKNNVAIIKGNTKFKGAHVTASDLRASVCLVLAGIAAVGETVIHRVYHIDRGYSRIEKKLIECGANIVRGTEES